LLYFRVLTDAAPLKRDDAVLAVPLMRDFRVLTDAAPLKRFRPFCSAVFRLDFRVLTDAAPLKLSDRTGYLIEVVLFPRPNRRGPIEAGERLRGSRWSPRISAS